MKRTHASTRRYLPGSPFQAPPAAAPAEQFEVDDRVSHDQYGLGTVVGVEPDGGLLIDFGSRRMKVLAPYTKLCKL